MIIGFISLILMLHVFYMWSAGLRRAIISREQVKPCPTLQRVTSAVSVLVPAWNEANTLPKTLVHLNQVKYPTWELIVIAGGTDETFIIAQQTQSTFTATTMQVYEQPPYGKNAALNIGLAHAQYDVIVILDADTLVQSDWLTAMITVIDAGYDAACGNFVPLRFTWISHYEQFMKIAAYQVHHQTILQGSGTIAIKRDMLLASGGFPEDVTVGVDYDLDMRVTACNAKKAFVEDAQVLTERPTSLREFWKNEVRWRRGHLRLLIDKYDSNIWQILRADKFYLTAVFPLVAISIVITFAALRFSSLATFFGLGTLMFMAWLMLRQSVMVIEVAAYTRKWTQLVWMWIPAILLLVSYGASWQSLRTLNHRNTHFKGRRSVKS